MPMSEQRKLFYESIHDAARDDIRALGGTKLVASRLKPEMTIEHAQRWLLDCLNPDRREKLDGEQLVLIMRLAREHGSFATAQYLMDAAGFERPRPLNREQERATLQEKFVAGVRDLQSLISRIEHLEDRP